MKVSIITTCFNRKGTIRAAIESVLGQTYEDIEYIIVDGGSTDGSREIIEEYRDRVAKIIFEPDRGMYEGLNKGVRAATGDVVAVCHSDDRLYSPNTVRLMVETLQRTNADMAYADGLYLRRRSQKKDEPARVWKSGNCSLWKLRCGWLPLHTTCYIRKSVYDSTELYDESYGIAADTKFLLDILYRKKIKTTYVPQFVVKMWMGGNSTDSNHFQHMWNEDLRAYHEMGFHYPTINKLMKMAWKVPQFVNAKLKRGLR